MPIRFQCGSCSQPIEVDDEWALRTVACPYCRKTITAPADSTLPSPEEVPMAAPVMTGTSGADLQSQQAYQPASPSDQANRLATVAFVIACCSVACLIAAQFVLAAHKAERVEMEELMRSAESFAEKTQAYNKFLEAHPEVLSWLIPASMLLVGGALTSVAALVCGLIAMRRPQRRGLAVAALVIAGLVPVLFCCGPGLGPQG